MTFDYPIILGAFLVFIPFIIVNIIKKKNRKALSIGLEKKFWASVSLFYLFLAFAIIAVAGPKWGIGYAYSEYRRGLDLVFAVDISRSMDIRDAQTNVSIQSRLERGLYIAGRTIEAVSGARYGTAIGRTRGYLAVPLTYDNETAAFFLESLDVSSMTGRSTNLEMLLEAAMGAFQSASPARKVIVLISDGESHSGNIRNAVNDCVREGIIINTVAVGSDEGRQISSVANDPGSEQVISRRDTTVMRTTAERTGGIYIDANREDAVSALSSHLLSISQETEGANSRQEPRSRRTLFIILALISYACSKFVTRQLPHNKPRLPLVSIIALFAIFTSCTEGKLLLMEANYLNSRGRYDEALASYLRAANHDDAAPYAEYGLGLTYHTLDESATALLRYENSQTMLEKLPENEHRELRYRNYYNTGIIFFEEGDYHSAADAFRDALREDPRKIEAKRNLELSLMSISAEVNRNTSTEAHEQQREILFELIMQEEQQRWQSREWSQEERYSGPDY